MKNLPSFRFCHISKFQAPDCLHYKHYNAVKGVITSSMSAKSPL